MVAGEGSEVSALGNAADMLLPGWKLLVGASSTSLEGDPEAFGFCAFPVISDI